MSSLTHIFKRNRSKSDKLTTPPKIVFGDLDSAYKSIAQKTPPCTPTGRVDLNGESSVLAEARSASSPIQSPQLDASPSAALLHPRASPTIRIRHLSEDLLVPAELESPVRKPKSPITWDSFDASDRKRTSFTTLEVTKSLLDGYFGVSSGDRVRASQEQVQSQSETKILPASAYPELEHAQLQACSVLSGTEKPHQDESSGTIQSVAKRHPYGRVNTNENIRSIHGSQELDPNRKHLENAQQGEVRQVEWSPRSSVEAGEVGAMSISAQRYPGAPPSRSLPQTPRNYGAVRYRIEDLSSPSKEGSPSSNSYGNTRRLLQISSPQLPEAPLPRENLYHRLLNFAREGRSSSSKSKSSTSFAEFCIEEAHGARITRAISQGEFQELQRTISENRRRESHVSDDTPGGGLVRVGQISFRFIDTSSEADLGPGSSQTASSASEVEVNWETGSVQVPDRTRNGTPPLLFGSHKQTRNDNDWETVGESNGMASSVADVSDSLSGSPPRSFPSLRPGQLLRHPAHPRYNHSWDLQQDRSGTIVLTPRYHQLPAGSSFPNQNALEPLALRAGSNNYSHPTPLTLSHNNPFVTQPVQIAREPQLAAANTQNELQSQGTSAWLSTTGDSDFATQTSPVGADSRFATAPLPPIPAKNPARRWHRRVSRDFLHHRHSFNFGFHGSKSKLDQVSAMEEGSAVQLPASPAAASAASLAPTTALNGPGSSAPRLPLRSPLRNNETKAKAFMQRPQAQSADDEEVLLNPFADPIDHDHNISRSASPATNPLASPVAFPENIFSPDRHRRPVDSNGTMEFITAEQARYMRSKSPDWAPNNMEMQAIISPRARTLAVPSPVSPRLWNPTPHPLAHLGGPRESSPHLCRLRRKQTPAASRRNMSHQQVVSRYYLVACGFVPPLLVLYFLGRLDWVMKLHTGGVHSFAKLRPLIYDPIQCVSFAIPPFVPGLIGAFCSKLPPPPAASCSAAYFFNKSIVTPFVSADSSVACMNTLHRADPLAQAINNPSNRSFHPSSVPDPLPISFPRDFQKTISPTNEQMKRKDDLLRHDRIFSPLRRIHGFFPPRGA
ncbi:MAG: hypothetical protein Q9168_000403 [Polycauliona sp. 1 TL-2023]